MEQILWARGEELQLAHIVEHGDPGQGALVALQAQGWPINVRSKQHPRTKQWFHPFGACDMVAYEHRKAIQEKLATGTHVIKMRRLLKELRKIPTKVVFADEAQLAQWCEATPDTYPRRDQ